jgi:acyl-homoserine-lactone acylase
MQVTWDDWAVPTITGDDEQDVVRGVGYAQAVAVGGDVLELYGIARGTAASYWGSRFVGEDTFTAQLGLDAKTDEWFAAQLPETLARVEAFCEGFNAACDEDPSIGAARREALPVTSRDVIAHILRVMVRFNQIDAAQLAFSPLDFYGVDTPAETTVGLLSAPVEPTGIEKPGSNSWAVAGSRSTTGNAMVMINPHLSWSLTYHRFFEFRTISPGRDFHGCTLIGAPWQSMGYSPKVAWGHTVNPIRNLVVFELKNLADGGYDFDGGRRELETRAHVIEVKGGEPVTVAERRSVHGPVLTAPDGTPVAIRMAGVLDNPAYHCLESWWQLSLAGSVEELFATHDRVWLPRFTMTAGDANGSVGALFCGTPPVRADWEDTRRRLPGDDPALLANEVHPASAMPRVVDPECGWVTNCNDTPWLFCDPPLDPDDYPANIAPPLHEVDDPRPLVSRDWLMRHETVSPQELLELKYHKRAVIADIVLDELLAAAKGHDDLADAVAVLEKWDRYLHADSGGAPLFWFWAVLNVPTAPFLGWLTKPAEPGALPTGLADVQQGVELLKAAVLTFALMGLPLDVSMGQLKTLGTGDEAVPADGGSGFLGSLKSLELAPTAAGTLEIAVGDTWVSRVQLQQDAPAVAESLLVYGNTTEPGAPSAPSQFKVWAADQLRPRA